MSSIVSVPACCLFCVSAACHFLRNTCTSHRRLRICVRWDLSIPPWDTMITIPHHIICIIYILLCTTKKSGTNNSVDFLSPARHKKQNQLECLSTSLLPERSGVERRPTVDGIKVDGMTHTHVCRIYLCRLYARGHQCIHSSLDIPDTPHSPLPLAVSGRYRRYKKKSCVSTCLTPCLLLDQPRSERLPCLSYHAAVLYPKGVEWRSK